ncbi:alpha/beta hydrolase [Stomatohabitans albus]|uniref:alpha/beta hydrolase n=1 Tax=Stomatohabitans albus TaxID=3110766 RepID=UPI00300CD201
MRSFTNVIVITVAVLLVAVGFAAVIINVVEQRSLRSWIVEQYMWAMGYKADGARAAHEGVEHLARLQEPDELTLPITSIGQTVTETRVDGMQVLSWNANDNPNQPILFYIHGGGYVHQASDMTLRAVDNIATQANARVVLPVYPLAPRHHVETALPKVIAAYAQTLTDIGNPDRITIMGDSAGGGLALALGQNLRKNGLAQPKQYIVFSPWVDATITNPALNRYDSLDPFLERGYLQMAGQAWAGPNGETQDPRVSPIYGDFRHMAPITVFMGTHEMFYADVEPLKNKLMQADIPHTIIVGERMNHAYPLIPIPEGEAARTRAATLLSAE